MWFRFLRKARHTSARRPARPSYRPRLMALEDRCLLSTPGAVDPTFGSGAGYVTTSLSSNNDAAGAVLIQPWDGKIVAAGFTQPSRSNVMGLVRYNANGSLDTSFGSSGKIVTKIGATLNLPAAALYLPTGTDTADEYKIVEASGGNIARFNPNGSVDTSFGSKGVATVPWSIAGVVILSNGDVVVGGDNGSSFELSRFTPNGKLDTSFGSGGTATLSLSYAISSDSIQMQSDGKLMISGEGASTAPANQLFVLARFTANGQLDTSFGGSGYVTGSFGTNAVGHAHLAIYPSTGPDSADYGKLAAVCTINGNPGGDNNNQIGLARYNPDGTIDNTFGTSGQVITSFPGTGSVAWATAVQPDGKLVVAGQTIASFGTQWDFSVLRYNANGSVDTTFGNGGQVLIANGTGFGRAWGVALDADGRIVAAGSTFRSSGGPFEFMVARFLVGPQIGSFTASPDPVTTGSNLTLTASNIVDGDPNGAVTQVTFYYFDGDGNEIVLGYGTEDASGNWNLTFTVNFTAGSYTLYAQAQDNDAIFGDAVSFNLTVS